MSVFRLIEGIISLARPTQPIGNAFFDGTYGPATDTLFDLGAIRKDIHIENNIEIIVKLGSASADPVAIRPGVWDFTEEWTDKLYITTSAATQIVIYANG
jgi:hypothetical protein